jgi:hypothetical protein
MLQKVFSKIWILILGVVIIASWFLVYQQLQILIKMPSGSEQLSKETEQPQADETANWKTYRNDEYGFELKYPNHWTFSEYQVGNGIAVGFESSKAIQEGCDIDAMGDAGDNPFSCPGNAFNINVERGLARDRYIENFKYSKLIVSQTEDVIIRGNRFTKITFANFGPQYVIEVNDFLLTFSSNANYERTDRIMLSTFRFLE